jgi:hypothetical protein
LTSATTLTIVLKTAGNYCRIGISCHRILKTVCPGETKKATFNSTGIYYFICVINSLIMQAMTEEDVEAVYLRERLRELEEEGGMADAGTDPGTGPDTDISGTGTGTSGGHSGFQAPAGAPETQSSKPPLNERLRSYLERSRAASSASSIGSGMSTGSTGNSGKKNSGKTDSNKNTDNTTASIRVIRKKMLEASGPNGDTSSISPAIRFTGPCGGEWGEPFWQKKDFGRKKIVTLSFDPTTGNCGVCDDEHLVCGSAGGGGGRGSPDSVFRC